MPLNQEILEENLSRTVILQLPDLDLILLSPLIEYITLYLPTGKLIFKATNPFLLVTLVYFLPLTLKTTFLASIGTLPTVNLTLKCVPAP